MTDFMYHVIFCGFLVLIGFIIAGAVSCLGGNWVQGWILGSIPAWCFWAADAKYYWCQEEYF